MDNCGEGNIATQWNKNGIPFTNNISAVINTSFWSLTVSLEILTMFHDTWIGFFLVVFHFKAGMFLPQTACTISIYWIITGQSMICWIWKIQLKYLTDAYPSLAYKVFDWSVPLICLFGNTCVFPETVFSSTTALSVGL